MDLLKHMIHIIALCVSSWYSHTDLKTFAFPGNSVYCHYVYATCSVMALLRYIFVANHLCSVRHTFDGSFGFHSIDYVSQSLCGAEI